MSRGGTKGGGKKRRSTRSGRAVSHSGVGAAPSVHDLPTVPAQAALPASAARPASPARPGTAPPATARPGAPVPCFELDVAVCEATSNSQQRAVELFAGLGCRVAREATADGIRGRDPAPEVVVIGLPEGQALLDELAARPTRPILIASLAAPAAPAPTRADAAGADLFVVRPHSKDSLVMALHAAHRLSHARGEHLAAAAAASLRAELVRYGQADAATGFRHFDFFKQLLEIEVKRAKRYGYSLAAGVVAFDAWPGEAPPPAVVARLRTQVAAAISSHIRDIDLPVDLATDRMLVFLPYTDLAGAERVGRRIAAAAKDATVTEAGATFHITVSIGIAAQRPGQPVSFSRLMRDANAALRAAQLKGGGRVVVRT